MYTTVLTERDMRGNRSFEAILAEKGHGEVRIVSSRNILDALIVLMNNGSSTEETGEIVVVEYENLPRN